MIRSEPAVSSPASGAADRSDKAAGSASAPAGHRSVLAAAGMISVAVLSSRVLGLVREALFAAIFGTRKFADAFVLAYRIPNLLRELFAEGAMSSAFVPTFTAALAGEGRERAHRLANLLFGGLLVVTGTLTVLGVGFAPVIVDVIAPGFHGDPEKRALAIVATRIMMPFLPLISCAAVAMGMSNAQRRFFLPAIAPATFNVVSILIGIGLYVSGCPMERAILGWSVGAVVSALAQFVVQVPPLWRLGWRFRPALHRIVHDPGIRRIARLVAPAILGLAAVQINILVNSIFASKLGDGPIAQLNYAWRMFYLPLGLFGVAIATVTATSVAEEAARGDRRALSQRVGHGLKLTWMLTVPSALGLMALSVPIIRLVYERGAFEPTDTAATAVVLMAYTVGLAPHGSIKTLGPAFYALDRPRVPMVASMLAVTVNVTFAALTYRRLGAAGLALGTALAAIVNVAVLGAAFRRMVEPMRDQHLGLAIAKIGVASVVTGAVAWGLWRGLEICCPVGRGGAVASGAARLTGVVVPAGVGALVYVLVCRLLRLREIEELTSLLSRRLKRR